MGMSGLSVGQSTYERVCLLGEGGGKEVKVGGGSIALGARTPLEDMRENRRNIFRGKPADSRFPDSPPRVHVMQFSTPGWFSDGPGS